MLGHAQDYLDDKYETIKNIINSRMDEIMEPCYLSENSIPEQHYRRIKKVVVDEVVQKYSCGTIYGNDNRNMEE